MWEKTRLSVLAALSALSVFAVLPAIAGGPQPILSFQFTELDGSEERIKISNFHSEGVVLLYDFFIYFSIPHFFILLFGFFSKEGLITKISFSSLVINLFVRCLNVESIPYSGIIISICSIFAFVILMLRENK